MALRFLSALFTGLTAAFFAGYVAFVVALPGKPHPDAEAADGLVVLTGGGGARIRQGLTLLEAGAGDRLLISGVYEETTSEDLRAFGPGAMTRFDCCVDIDRAAKNTIGNGAETANWARSHGFQTVGVVTHRFHMPRAMIELKRAAPDIEYRPYPVGGVFSRGPRQTTLEYLKFLVILTRDSVTSPPGEHNA
ncbi:MAG: YdcF family protein [Euryhalocaulis sp.]|uniref:YdcF family protein n=1 Tax=Euryhalocaulis sp. TaxID=2744307 RepID=UPI0017FA82AF|nr:YdcF family protein [Euryhalocaulis sp.]MBA4800898.1 YdcF family protein [Euryhalocaulis sp.]